MTRYLFIVLFSFIGAVNWLPAAAAPTIGSNDIKRNAVRSKHIKKNSVKSSDIAPGAVESSDIRDGEVTNADLADGAVSGSTLADGAVTDSKILDRAVTRSKIADGAVSAEKLGCCFVTAVGPDVTLGAAGDDGDLTLKDGSGVASVILDGDSANITNRFSNTADQGNGLIKAWARINTAGTVAECWNCNTDVTETRRLDTGEYEVDFTPLGTDITARPRSLTLDTQAGGSVAWMAGIGDRDGDASSVFVQVRNNNDTAVNSGFNVFIY